MILYVDETENDDYFIVAGLLANNKHDINMAYRHFINRIKNYPLSRRDKEKIYIEFKSFVMDRHYQRIKRIMLEEIIKIDNCKIIYSVKLKKIQHLKQIDKENIYKELITKIASTCDDVFIIYDGFNNPRFENKINGALYRLNNVIDAMPMNSQEESGLKFVDNLCSVIRLHMTNLDKNKFYEYISSNTVEI